MRISDLFELVLKRIFNQFWLLDGISIFQEEHVAPKAQITEKLAPEKRYGEILFQKVAYGP